MKNSSQCDKRHIYFWNLSKYKPYEKKWGDMAYYVPRV